MLNKHELALNLIDSVGISRATSRHDFYAMGTHFYFVAVNTSPEVFETLEMRTRELESCWTRFSLDSELMQLNLSRGAKRTVSSDLTILLTEMIRGYELTEGRFNPSVLPTLMRHGFVTDDDVLNSSVMREDTCVGSLTDITVNREEHTAQLPLGMMLDAGGIGKGLAADLLAEQAIELGAGGIAVFAGGEVAVRGQAPTGGGWTIGVQNPWDANDVLDVVELARGGIATSSSEARTMNDSHHLIDPKTSESFQTDIVQATVLCDRATDAEVLTKACFAHNHTAALAMVKEAGAQALLVTNDGAIHRSDGWEDYT